MRTTTKLIPVLLLASACKPEQNISRVIHSDVFLQEPTNEVDILWVVDNSNSMADEQEEIAEKFESFITHIEESNADFHIGVITTDLDHPDQNGKLQGDPLFLTPEDDYVELFQERIQIGIEGSPQEKGIDAALTALSEPLVSSYNAGFRRPGATLSIIYVSDENDCTDRGALAGYEDEVTACYDHSDLLVDVKVLIDEYRHLQLQDERVVVSAIVGPEIDEGCDGSKPGFRYLAMAEAFGGLQGSICEADFSRIMSDLSLEVSGVRTSFQLSHAAVEGTIEVAVGDSLVPEDETNGWTYDPEYWMVYFHGDGVPPRGSTITITYEVANSGTQQLEDTGG
ncbi:MAG: VWA domain-containing protein [Deltaproteobacteria bacterium]|nr:MAG: VWA domain-containing protein [Deltaproteobacteria bacterium]